MTGCTYKSNAGLHALTNGLSQAKVVEIMASFEPRKAADTIAPLGFGAHALTNGLSEATVVEFSARFEPRKAANTIAPRGQLPKCQKCCASALISE